MTIKLRGATQLYEIACVVIAFALSLFLTIVGYILQRNKYWRRVWMELGKPEVENVKELKALVKKQGYHRKWRRHKPVAGVVGKAPRH